MTNTFQPLSNKEELIGKQLVNIAFTIHKILGPGLLESVYEKCFCHELHKKNIKFSRQKIVEIIYDGIKIDEGLRIDIFVEDKIVVELKAQENYHPVWEAQLLSYFKTYRKSSGIHFQLPCTLNERWNKKNDFIKRLQSNRYKVCLVKLCALLSLWFYKKFYA